MSGKTLTKAVSILDCFTQAEPVWTATSLSRRLRIPVPTLHGLLAALVDLDFLARSEPSKEYRLGFRYLEMGQLHASSSELNSIAQAVMRGLAFGNNLLGLNILHKGWMYNSITVLPLKNTNAFKFAGPRIPAHLAAGGLAMMAYLGRDELEGYYRIDWSERNMPPPCPWEEMEEQLREIRKKGYAVGKSLVSLVEQSTIATPVFGRNRAILAALVLLSTEEPFSVDKMEEVAARLRLAAGEISNNCGHISRPQRVMEGGSAKEEAAHARSVTRRQTSP